MREQFIAAWVSAHQRIYHQRTRGIMTPEDRQALEDEAEKAMREIEAEAWDRGFDAGEADVFLHERGSFDDPCIQNPYRKEIE